MKDDHSHEPKERILRAAIQLFARKGYSATGVRELAKEADVNISMISYYFGSKRGVLEEILNYFFKNYQSIIDQALFIDASIDQKVRSFTRKVVDFFRKDPDLIRVAFTEMPFDLPNIAEFKAERIRKIIPLGQSRFIKDLEAKGELPFKTEIIGPAIIGMIVFHFLMRPVIESIFGQSFDDEFYDTYSDEVANLFLYGVIGQQMEYKD